jgi:outer membrane biosynthesis protein TonB
MSVLYLAFETHERQSRLAKLQKSGAHIVVAEPRWPGFFELAKREKPFAIAIDFSSAPSHALETADYLTKARETKEAALFLLRVQADRLEGAQKRLPNAIVVTESELSARLARMEQEAQARALQKKEAASQAKKMARAAARTAAGLGVEKGKPAPAPGKAKAVAKPVKSAAKPIKPVAKSVAKPAARPVKPTAKGAPAPPPKKKTAKKPAAPTRKPQPRKKK